MMRQLSWTHILEVLPLKNPLQSEFYLTQLDGSSIKVAQYLTELPSREILLEQIRKSISIAEQHGLALDKDD